MAQHQTKNGTRVIEMKNKTKLANWKVFPSSSRYSLNRIKQILLRLPLITDHCRDLERITIQSTHVKVPVFLSQHGDRMSFDEFLRPVTGIGLVQRYETKNPVVYAYKVRNNMNTNEFISRIIREIDVPAESVVFEEEKVNQIGIKVSMKITPQTREKLLKIKMICEIENKIVRFFDELYVRHCDIEQSYYVGHHQCDLIPRHRKCAEAFHQNGCVIGCGTCQSKGEHSGDEMKQLCVKLLTMILYGIIDVNYNYHKVYLEFFYNH